MHTFLEAQEKTAVFTYGRNNPPTVGHEKLFNKTVETAKKHGTVAHIFTSHSQDGKKNPLSAEHKVELIKHAYPEAHVAASSKEMPSMLHIAKHLHDQGHKHLVMVAGSDRVDEYKKKLNQYNGTHEGALYNFKSIRVVSAGQRDPDAEGAEGMSGTKLRSHAISGNKDKFKSGLLSGLSDEHKENVYHAVRKALKVEEVFSPRLKISKFEWGTPEGTAEMKRITPGEATTKKKPTMEHLTPTKIPYLLMTSEQKQALYEQNSQLEFDGIQTRHFDMCPKAYEQFSKMIKTIRAGGHLGEKTGHEPDKLPAPGLPPEMALRPSEIKNGRASQTGDAQRQVMVGIAVKPTRLKHMQFKQYVGL